jgi:hypothetical protein
MKIVSKLLLIAVFALFSYTVSAQSGTGIGIHYGTDAGIGLTVLKFLSDRNQHAVNLNLSAPYSGFRANLNYEFHLRNHSENIEVAGVGFFIGAGGHIGRYKTQSYRKNTTDPIDKTNIMTAGIDGIVGVEWKLPHVPLLLSADVHPFYDLNYTHQPSMLEFGVALRYFF